MLVTDKERVSKRIISPEVCCEVVVGTAVGIAFEKGVAGDGNEDGYAK